MRLCWQQFFYIYIFVHFSSHVVGHSSWTVFCYSKQPISPVEMFFFISERKINIAYWKRWQRWHFAWDAAAMCSGLCWSAYCRLNCNFCLLDFVHIMQVCNLHRWKKSIWRHLLLFFLHLSLLSAIWSPPPPHSTDVKHDINGMIKLINLNPFFVINKIWFCFSFDSCIGYCEG